MSVPAPDMLTCGQWGAVKPRETPKVVGRPERILIHHTAGHHPEIWDTKDESTAEAIAYAKAIQHSHMVGNHWIDSGHSFLVCRNGMILQGRWGTVTAIEHGWMVESAHCPGQNDQPGIEHEHKGTETITGAQYWASVHLCAWICDRCHIRPTELFPHRHYYATACPGNLADSIPYLRADVAALLNAHGRREPRLIALTSGIVGDLVRQEIDN